VELSRRFLFYEVAEREDKMKIIVRSIAVITVILIGGCSTPQKKVTLPETTTKINAGDLMEGQEAILWERPSPAPKWIDAPSEYEHQKPNCLYFVGVSVPNEYEQSAIDDALKHGSQEIANYLFNLVDDKKFIAESMRNSQGYVPVQTLARDVMKEQIANAAIQGQYGVQKYTRRVVKKQYGALQYFYVVYRLFELPKNGVVNALTETQEKLQQEYAKERDEIKKELLKANENMIEEIKRKTFEASK
jgi:hypothetical protein